MPLDIFSKIQANDRKFLSKIYHENYFKTNSYIKKNNGTETDAQDIFHEAIISLWSSIKMKKFMPQNQNELEAYLFKIAKNKWIDVLRKRKTMQVQSIKGSVFNEDDKKERDRESEYLTISQSLQEMGEPCSGLLKKFYFEKMSYETISQSMPYDKQTLKTMKYRCMKKLRKLLVKNSDNDIS